MNRKRVQRIWREERLCVPAKAKKRRRPRRVHGPRRTAQGPVPQTRLALDYQHDATDDVRELKFLSIVDEFTREAWRSRSTAR
jgi:putative transposase